LALIGRIKPAADTSTAALGGEVPFLERQQVARAGVEDG